MWMILSLKAKITTGRFMMQKSHGSRSGIATRKHMKRCRNAWGLSSGGGYAVSSLPYAQSCWQPSSSAQRLSISNMGIACSRLFGYYGIIGLKRAGLFSCGNHRKQTPQSTSRGHRRSPRMHQMPSSSRSFIPWGSEHGTVGVRVGRPCSWRRTWHVYRCGITGGWIQLGQASRWWGFGMI